MPIRRAFMGLLWSHRSNSPMRTAVRSPIRKTAATPESISQTASSALRYVGCSSFEISIWRTSGSSGLRRPYAVLELFTAEPELGSSPEALVPVAARSPHKSTQSAPIVLVADTSGENHYLVLELRPGRRMRSRDLGNRNSRPTHFRRCLSIWLRVRSELTHENEACVRVWLLRCRHCGCGSRRLIRHIWMESSQLHTALSLRWTPGNY